MRGIERVVAALLLAAAVAGAVVLPRLTAGPDSTAPLAGATLQRVTTIVEAAPLPVPKPTVVRRVVIRPVAHTAAVAAAKPHPVQPAPRVPAPAPAVVQTPPPVATPSTQAPAVSAPVVAAPTPALVLARGKGHGKGHD